MDGLEVLTWPDVVKELIARGTPVNASDDKGRTALVWRFLQDTATSMCWFVDMQRAPARPSGIRWDSSWARTVAA
jgi:hypothetical protein